MTEGVPPTEQQAEEPAVSPRAGTDPESTATQGGETEGGGETRGDETQATQVQDSEDRAHEPQSAAGRSAERRAAERLAAEGAGPDEQSADGDGAGTAVAQLEEEGDVAADYLEELLDIVDLDGDLDLDVEGDRAAVAIIGDGLGDLVGRHGEVLDALQELTRLAVLRATGTRSRLMLDIGGYRARKRESLEAQAREVVEEVERSGEPQRLAPMTPFERKVVHDAVAAAGLKSESEGEEPNRRVVVLPA